MKNIKLKLTAISPIHTGSGEVYEPTNFIIDENSQKQLVLYHFRDEDFFEALSNDKQQKFLKILNEMKEDSFIKIHKFVKENKEIAKKISFLKVLVTKGIYEKYKKVIGQIAHLEKRGRSGNRVFNQFEIQRIQRKQLKSSKTGNFTYVPYIPGSSLKGAISTAYKEFIYQNYGERKLKELFEDVRNMENLKFRFFKVADSKTTKPKSIIGFSLNKERFEDDNTGPSTFIEVLNTGSEYIVDITFDENEINFNDIKIACNNHYEPIFNKMLDGEAENISGYFSDKLYNYYCDLKLKPNQFLLRVGKHSGARAVTIDGLRDISIRENRRKTIHHQSEETTTWLFGNNENSNTNLQPFGWVLCEIIS